MALNNATGKTALKRKTAVRGRRSASAVADTDGELIRWCREFGALEQRILIATISLDSAARRDKITAPLYRRQDKLLESIRGTRPHTLAACKAVASVLGLLTRFLGEGGTNWDLLTGLLGGLAKLKD